MYVTSFLSIPCLSILDIRNIGIADLRFGHLSDLIHGITENGLRYASGPVQWKHPIRYMYTTEIIKWENKNQTRYKKLLLTNITDSGFSCWAKEWNR